MEHFKDGKLNDGRNGEAAIERFDETGQLTFMERYKNGVVSTVMHFRNGKLNDGPNGEPAAQQFDDNGKLSQAARFKDGVLVGPADAPKPGGGNPAP